MIEEDAETIAVMIAEDGTLITIANPPDPDRCPMTDGRDEEEDRDRRSVRRRGVHRDRVRDRDLGDLAIKRRVHHRDTKSRGDTRLRDRARDRTADAGAAADRVDDPSRSRGVILGADPGIDDDRRGRSRRHRGQRMTGRETKNAGTARIRNTRATGRRALGVHDRGPTRFTVDLRPKVHRGPGPGGSHRDEGIMENAMKRRTKR